MAQLIEFKSCWQMSITNFMTFLNIFCEIRLHVE